MKLVNGNLWNSRDEIILVTTNAYIRKDGALVMGRGAASEAKNKYPNVPYLLGEQISKLYKDTKRYGVLVVNPWYNSEGMFSYLPILVGAFQVKYNWWEDADLELIDFSCKKLNYLIRSEFPNKSFSMNFPGIGNGRLELNNVLPIVEQLDDRVTIYHRE